jgi:hypothetical protein
MVVLSTRAERSRIPLLGAETARERRNRRARVKRAAVR